MYPRRSHRTPKPSVKINESDLSPNEEEIQRKTNSRRQRRDCDILDIINRTHEANGFSEEDEGEFTADKEVEEFDEDCLSADSSIASGPSALFKASPIKERLSQSLCSACQKLYLRAKRKKGPIIDKLLDNDPMSLTCDQWVLIKSWRPRRLPNPIGKLLTHVTLAKRRLRLKASASQTELCVREGEPPACSRPHTFLQRNLRQRTRASVKKVTKKNKKKRKTDDPRGSRVAKQQRLHSSNHYQHVNTVSTDSNSYPSTSSPSSSPVQEQRSNQEMDAVTVELIPCSVTLEDIRKILPKQSPVKKRGGFRDLLAQLRGNSSMIVRETR